MYFKSKKISLLILAVASLVASRVLFLFFNDPEGPNLLVVVGAAAIIFVVSLLGYLYYPLAKLIGLKRLFLAIFTQAILITLLYLFLR